MHEIGAKAERALPLLPACLALITGAVFLGSKGFTSDEAVSVTMARLPWHRFGELIVHRETNGSLYFTLLHLLAGGNGGEGAARALSLAAFVAASATFFLLVRRLFAARIAAIAAILFAINPVHVEYAQTAHEYLLALLLVVGATYLFVRGVQEPSAAVWALYAVVSALSVYAFVLAAVVPVAHALSLAALPRERVRWRLAATSLGGFFMLLVPLVYFVTQTKASAGIAWASGNLPGRLTISFRDHFPRAVLVVLLAALTVGLAYAWWRAAGRYSWPVTLLVAWLVVPAYLVTAAGLVWQPLFIVRYFMIFAPPLLVLVAVVLDKLHGPSLAAAVVLVLVLAGYGLVRWYADGGADYRGASVYVAASSHPGDGVLFYAPYIRLPFELYFEGTAAARSNRARAVYPADPWSRASATFIKTVLMPERPISEALRPYRRVWLVLSHYRSAGRADPGYDNVISALSGRNFRFVQKRSFAGLALRRYDR
ncbi:MAG: glycosyltransferase family 39 protein [Actinomycetota bacterium]|nr:glycosyltransferase family 39 protein [Actinomycetota bacterium]